MSGLNPPGAAWLVGRTTEMSALASGLDQAAQGRALIIVINGATGTGKTALLDALEEHARCEGAVVLRGSPSPTGPRRPWQVAEGLLGEPAKSERPAVPPSQHLLGRLRAVAASSPTVIMLDDAHLCDEESLAWLDSLADRGRDLRLLVVLAHGRALGTRAGPAIELAPLGDRDAGELARQRGIVVEEPVAEICNRICRGIPSLLVALLEGLSGEIDRGERRVRELGGALYATHVLAIVDRHPEYVREVLAAVAVLEQADEELVAMLGAVPRSLVAAAIGILRDERVIDGLADLNDDLLRSRILGTMTTEGLQRSRERAARLLNDAGRPVGEISAQLLRLHTLPESWMPGVLREAAVAAEQSASVAMAVRYLRRIVAADLADIEALDNLAQLVGRDDPAEAYEMLHTWIVRLDDPRGQTRLAERLAQLAPRVGKERQAASVLNAVLRETDHHELRTAVRSALTRLGDAHWSTRVIAERVTAMGLQEADGASELERLAVRSMISALSGSTPRACVAMARRALSGSETSSALGPAALVLALADQVEEAVRAADRMLAEATRHKDAWATTRALSTRSLIMGETGDLGRAFTDASRAVELADEWLQPRGGTGPRTALVAVLAQRGEAGRAASTLAELAVLNVEDSPLDHPRVLMARSQLEASRGDHEGALSSLTACGALLGETGIRNSRFLPWWLDASCLLARLDRGDEAIGLVEQGEELASDWDTPSVRGFALLARGAVTGGSAGVESLTESVATLSRSPARWYLVQAETLLGEALLRLGDREGARGHFRQAVYVAVRCGFRVPAAKARDRLVAAGGWMAQGEGVLTAAERRIAELAVSGSTNREIARTLSIAVRTVESHLTSIFRKLEVSGRADLTWALNARREGGMGQTAVG